MKKTLSVPKYNEQGLAYVLMIILAVSPVFGIFMQTTTKTLYTAMYFYKAMVVRIIGFVGLINYIFYCINRMPVVRLGKKPISVKPWTVLLLLTFLFSLFSLIGSSDFYRSFFGYSYRFSGVFTYIAYIGIYLAASLCRDEDKRIKVLNCFLITGGVAAAATLLQQFAGMSFLFMRNGYTMAFSGPFLNPNHYGYYLCVVIIVSVFYGILTEKLSGKIIAGVVFLLNLITLQYNQSMGPYYATVIALIVGFVLVLIRKHDLKTVVSVALVVVLFVGCLFLFNTDNLTKDISTVLSDVKTISDDISGTSEEDSGSAGSGRWAIWKATLEVIKENPLFGVGPENIYYAIADALGSTKIPHNEYLQYAADLGIPAVLCYIGSLLALLIINIINIKKISNSALIAGLGAMVYCLSAFTGVEMPICTFALFLMLGINNSYHCENIKSNTLAI